MRPDPWQSTCSAKIPSTRCLDVAGAFQPLSSRLCELWSQHQTENQDSQSVKESMANLNGWYSCGLDWIGLDWVKRKSKTSYFLTWTETLLKSTSPLKSALVNTCVCCGRVIITIIIKYYLQFHNSQN
jgi:hypothetical protein